jgi:hypothetical protein
MNSNMPFKQPIYYSNAPGLVSNNNTVNNNLNNSAT